MTTDPEQLMTAREVADLLQLHTRTIERWARDGILPKAVLPGRTVRFRRADVVALVRASA